MIVFGHKGHKTPGKTACHYLPLLLISYTIVLTMLISCTGANSNKTASPKQTNPRYLDCVGDQRVADFIEKDYASVDEKLIRMAGRLYDTWWTAESNTIQAAKKPLDDHPLWQKRYVDRASSKPINKESGSQTWRCKECHGWDYKGKDGEYKFGSSRYTNFPGLMQARSKSEIQLYCSIREGTATEINHAFNYETTGVITDLYILSMVKFIKQELYDASELFDERNKIIVPENEFAQRLQNGETLYYNHGCDHCHGNEGDSNIRVGDDNNVEGQLGLQSIASPMETIHKLRFGDLSSVENESLLVGTQQQRKMQDFLDEFDIHSPLGIDSLTNLFVFMQNSLKSDSCAFRYNQFVQDNFDRANTLAGGRMYDTWWAEDIISPPDVDHPLWQRRDLSSINTSRRAATWRCKECHGWDYLGRDGQYGSGAHYTGFPGVLSALNKSPAEVFCAIKEGTPDYPEHVFEINNTSGFMSDERILELTKFVTDARDNFGDTRNELGMINTGDYISGRQPVFTDLASGRGIFMNNQNCSDANCHGTQGLANIDGGRGTLRQLTEDNPWEVLHKIRYGQPGSSMPSFLNNGLDNQQISNVMHFMITELPSSGNSQPSNCQTTFESFVSDNFAQANVTNGGKLYDNWWTAQGNPSGPTTNHPLWSLKSGTANSSSGQATWRCKECHGWDYAGVSGAYGSGSHYTGFPGILQAQGKSALDVFCAIREGTAARPQHGFNLDDPNSPVTSSDISNLSILDLTRFVLDTQRGAVNTTDFIVPDTGVSFGRPSDGLTVYTASGCAAASCHSPGGSLAQTGVSSPEELALLADSNPWEFFHKIRFGHPGSSMPAYQDNRPVTELNNVVAYAQQGLQAPVIPPPDPINPIEPVNPADAVARGALLFDNWWRLKGVNPPPGEHPIYQFFGLNNPAIRVPGVQGDSWRCSFCHGFDYKHSALENLIQPTGTQSTLNSGLIARVSSMSDGDIVNAITNGFALQPQHNFALNNMLEQADAEDIVAFLRSLVNVDDYIERTTGTPKVATSLGNGQNLYAQLAVAGSSTPGLCLVCHGSDGSSRPAGAPTGVSTDPLGSLSRRDPWLSLHRIRYGVPGSAMPALELTTTSAPGVSPPQTGTLSDALDLLVYLQSFSP